MSSKKIQNLPLKTPIDAMKLPTGGFGDYAISLKTLLDHFVKVHNITNKDDLQKLQDQLLSVIDLKSDKATTYTKDEVDSALNDKAQEILDDLNFQVESIDSYIKPPNVIENVVERFSADCWTIDGNTSASFCVYSEEENSFTASYTNRKTNDFVATIFFSEDKSSHPFLSYETKRNFESCVLSFSIDVDGDVPSIVDEKLGITMTVITLDKSGKEVPYYLRLANLADENTLTDTHADITIDWDNVLAGYNEDINFDKTKIERIFIGCITNGYDSTKNQPLPTHETGLIKISKISSKGLNGAYIRKSLTVPQHTLGLCTSYDDSYNVNPARIIKNCYDLGYRGILNHYCGMSHYPDKLWDETQGRFVLTKPSDSDTHNLVNKETTLWHYYLAKSCKEYYMTPLFSISYEMYSEHAELDWTQRQYNDEYGRTGYEPPSYLLSPCNEEAMEYLQKVFLEFSDISASLNLTPYLQVGEPWWWINSNGKPCIYDYQTRLKFNNETGFYAPEIEDKNTVIDSDDYRAFLKFLQKELGNSVVAVKTEVNKKYPEAKVSTLFFLPSILDDMTSIASIINYPVDQYKYPNLDFIQTETYDWLVIGEFNKALRGFTSAIDELGYPPDLVHYLAGFVPDNNLGELIKPNYDLDTDGVKIWQSIFGNMYLGKEYNVAKQYIWAYNQIVRDGIVVYPQDFLKRFWIKDKLYVSQTVQGYITGTPVVNLPVDNIRPNQPEDSNL